jgi:hypothetical protein
LNTRPDSVGSFDDARDSAVNRRASLDGETATALRIAVQNGDNSLTKPAYPAPLEAVRLTLTSIADTAILLAIAPLLMFTGPSQPDTAYGVALPAIILGLSPLSGWLITRKVSSFHWIVVSCLVRLVLATVVLYSPDMPFLSGGFLAIVLAFTWGMRLQDSVASARVQTQSRLLAIANFAAPAVGLMALLKFYEFVQPHLVSSAIAFYATAAVLLFATALTFKSTSPMMTLKNNASTLTSKINSRMMTWSPEFHPGLAAYEVFLSCVAGLIFIVPVLLLLTDQSAILPRLRTDVMYMLSGWLCGSLLAFVLSSNKTKSKLSLEHLHLLFTVLLGALSFCKFPTLACVLLFSTSTLAATIAIRISNSCSASAESERPSWQPALTMAILVGISILCYLELSPKLSALQPIHVDRTLAAICFIPSLIAIFAWSGSRTMILRLVSYLVPVQNPMRKQFPLYIVKNLEIGKAIFVGWRLDADIIILSQDATTASTLMKNALQLGNIYTLSLPEWNLASELIVERISNGERFLIYDFTASPLEEISLLPAQSAIGLIQRVQDQNAIVISDMVQRSSVSAYGTVR